MREIQFSRTLWLFPNVHAMNYLLCRTAGDNTQAFIGFSSFKGVDVILKLSIQLYHTLILGIFLTHGLLTRVASQLINYEETCCDD